MPLQVKCRSHFPHELQIPPWYRAKYAPGIQQPLDVNDQNDSGNDHDDGEKGAGEEEDRKYSVQVKWSQKPTEQIGLPWRSNFQPKEKDGNDHIYIPETSAHHTCPIWLYKPFYQY